MSQKRRLDTGGGGDDDDVGDNINLSLDEIARKNRNSLNNNGSPKNYHKRNKIIYQKPKRSKWDRLKDNDDDDDDSGDDDSPCKKYSSSDEDNEPIDIKKNTHELEEVILETSQSQKLHGMNSHNNTYYQDDNIDDPRSTPTSDFYEYSNEGSVSEYEEPQQQQQPQNNYQFSQHINRNNNEEPSQISRNSKYTTTTQQNRHNNFPNNNNKYQKFNNNFNRRQIYRQPQQQFFNGKRSFNNNSRMNYNNNNRNNNNNNDGSSSDDDEPVDITKPIGGDFAVEETTLNFNYQNYNTAQPPFPMVPNQTYPSSASSSSPSSSTSSLSYNFNLEQALVGNSNGSSSVSSLDGIGPINKKMRFQNENIFLSQNVSPQHEAHSVSQNSSTGNQLIARNPFTMNDMMIPPPKTNMLTPLKQMDGKKLPASTTTTTTTTTNPFFATPQTSEKHTVSQNPFFAKSQNVDNKQPVKQNPFITKPQKTENKTFVATQNIESPFQEQQQQNIAQNPFFMTQKKPILPLSVTTDKKENQPVFEKKKTPLFTEKVTKHAYNHSNINNSNNSSNSNQLSFVGITTPKKGNYKLITFENDPDTEKEIKMAVIDSDSDADTEKEKEIKMAVIDSDSDNDSSSMSKGTSYSRNTTLDSSLNFSGIVSPEVSGNLSLDEIISKKTGKTLSRRGSLNNNNSKAIGKGCPPELLQDPKMIKYWHQRYKLFSKYDEGIKLDYESWYSVTPEEIAICIAEKCKNPDGIIIDAFCGCGGNSIQFASRVKKVIAIDIDPVKIEYAKHNARIYGVYDKIEFVVGNFMELAPILKADMVFLSPPWGGVEYLKSLVFDLRTMIPLDGFKVFELSKMITPNIAYFVPRTTDREQLSELAGTGKVDIEQNKLGSRVLTITAYYGQLAEPSEKVKTV